MPFMWKFPGGEDKTNLTVQRCSIIFVERIHQSTFAKQHVNLEHSTNNSLADLSVSPECTAEHPNNDNSPKSHCIGLNNRCY